MPSARFGQPPQSSLAKLCRLQGPDPELLPTIRLYLLWTRAGRLTEQARAVIEALQESDTKGLNSEDYDGPRWTDRLLGLKDAANPSTEATLAEFDLALTISTMRYISDLQFGRANPGLFRDASDIESEEFDLASFLPERLAHAIDAKAALEGIEPPYQGYRRTEQALQHYIAMAREDHVGLLPVTKKAIEPGGSYAALAQLAERLQLLGDLPGN